MENSWNIYRKYVTTMTDYLLHYTSSEKFKKEETLKLFLWNTGIFLLERFFYKFFRFF